MGTIRKLLTRLTQGPSFESGFEPVAATLPDAPPPKAPNKQSSYPGYRTQLAASTAAIAKKDRQLARTDSLSLRNASSTKAVVRNFAIASPDLSATVSAYLRVGIPEAYTVIARNMDGTINPTATQLAHEILRRVTFVPDYTQGFNPQASVYSLACSLGKEFLYYGSAALEVVLDKARIPALFAPVHTPSLKFYEEDQGVRPVQEVGGVEIDLDIPTFIYGSLDQDLLDAYSSSPLEAAIQPVLADQEFMNDLRRVLKRAVQPRVTAKIVEEKLKKAAPAEVLNDPELFKEFCNTILTAVEDTLAGLNPEDAIVSLDMIEYSYMAGDQGDVAGNFKAVQDLLNAKMATGAKTMPAVLGHGQGGNHASTEAILFVKYANALRINIGELFSKALTVSCRVMGEPVYVEFKYATIDMRPEAELEAYKLMRQNRITDLWSYGVMTDEEACVELTGNLPPAGMPALSGTMFKMPSANPEGNPNSNTSAMEQANTPKTPKQPKTSK